MKFGPVTPARIDFDAEHGPWAPDFGDRYSGLAGPLGQAEHVFLAGNRLPQRWRGRSRFVVLETGFGLGHNFLATWAAWRADPQRPQRLYFLSLDKHPPSLDDLARGHAHGALPDLAAALRQAWPPATPDLHRRVFDDGRVTLLLGWGDVAAVLPQWVAQVDAFFLDGFAPARNPAMWLPRTLKALPRLAAPDATLATWSVARELRDTLAQLGFDVRKAPGVGGKFEITVASFQPRFVPPPPPGRRPATQARQALVIGAGLAGAATAQALAAEGLDVTVLEAQAGTAQQTSGNAGGLFHGVLHADDTPHARWYRACALQAEQRLRPWLQGGELPGALQGLLRLETELGLPAMHQRLQRSGLPPEHVQVLQALPAGTSQPAWLFPGGGWVSPAALAARLLQTPGCTARHGAQVQALEPVDQHWRARLADGRPVEADVVVLANAHDAARLARPWTGASWPVLNRVRGQISLVPAALRPPRLARPLAGSGYALSLPDGALLCGATTQPGDDDPAVRADDHRHNLQRLATLTGWRPREVDLALLQGRVGWRLVAPDRLPLLGPLPRAGSQATREGQPRFVERVPGLYVHTALGSRGISQALLGGPLLAAWICGAPLPLPAALVDAVDVARFAARSVVNRS